MASRSVPTTPRARAALASAATAALLAAAVGCSSDDVADPAPETTESTTSTTTSLADDAGEEHGHDAPAAASVSLLSPADGERVYGPVTVRMAAEGIEIVPAGRSVSTPVGLRSAVPRTPSPSTSSPVRTRRAPLP